MIIVATSAENNCLYCVVAHGAILRLSAKSPTISDQVNYIAHYKLIITVYSML